MSREKIIDKAKGRVRNYANDLLDVADDEDEPVGFVGSPEFLEETK